MKKVFLAASILIAATTFSGNVIANAANYSVVSKGDGQHISESQVPKPVLSSFYAQFPNAKNVQWEKEREHGQVTYQADFKQNGKRWRAEYTADGTLIKAGPR